MDDGKESDVLNETQEGVRGRVAERAVLFERWAVKTLRSVRSLSKRCWAPGLCWAMSGQAQRLKTLFQVLEPVIEFPLSQINGILTGCDECSVGEGQAATDSAGSGDLSEGVRRPWNGGEGRS